MGEKAYERTGLDALEITPEVLESELSTVLGQTENRMRAIKAVLVATAGV